MKLRELLRPYRAAFASRFLQMLQYRTAAYAGFATQCWWGGIKVMVLAAFYAGAAADAPMSLAQAITYTWLAQGLLALLPLTAAFVEDDGTIANLADMKPQTLDSHCSAKPVRYVLEMNQGWFAKRGIQAGTKLSGAPFKRK